eukprot:869580-Pleurochrysis_carterae.AAC.1
MSENECERARHRPRAALACKLSGFEHGDCCLRTRCQATSVTAPDTPLRCAEHAPCAQGHDVSPGSLSQESARSGPR